MFPVSVLDSLESTFFINHILNNFIYFSGILAKLLFWKSWKIPRKTVLEKLLFSNSSFPIYQYKLYWKRNPPQSPPVSNSRTTVRAEYSLFFRKFYLQLLRFVTFLSINRKNQFRKILSKLTNRKNYFPKIARFGPAVRKSFCP